MSHSVLSNSEFISKIIQDADSGRCFVPLIGSGLSSPSGIIMGMEFTNYLAFTTYLVLSDPTGRPRTHGEGQPQHWDLRHQGWPPLPTEDEVAAARHWVLNEFTIICGRYELDLNFDDNRDQKNVRSLTPRHSSVASHEILATLVHPKIPSILASRDVVRTDESIRRVADLLLRRAPMGSQRQGHLGELPFSDTTRSYQDRVTEAGIRSLHDWRETLVFLASVKVEDNGVSIDAPMSSVIDRFNSFITRDKLPNLGHKMLAHLSGPMRIHAILTTNFDTLLEDAFRMLNLPVRVLPVSSRGHLPEPQTVGSDFSIVKLHGEIHDTRADMTLDEEPGDVDKLTFNTYLTRGAGHPRRKMPARPESKRLLVIGYSGADNRVLQMIKNWLETKTERGSQLRRTAPGELVYWVCFSDADVRRVKQLFAAKAYDRQIRITQAAQPDLLLYELYQRLRLALPAGGINYEFSHLVTPRRLKPVDNSPNQIQNVLQCAETLEHPLEAARVLTSEAPSLEDARRLSRDAAVTELKMLVLDAVAGAIKFRDEHGNFVDHIRRHSIASVWTPKYRGASKHQSNTQCHPVVIDAYGGVVRGVAEAVAELTSQKYKKVFWIETQDYMDADSLLGDLLRSLAIRCGCFQGRYVTPHPLEERLCDAVKNPETSSNGNQNAKWKDFAGRIGRHLVTTLEDYRLTSHELAIFIYGRDSYGGCAGLIESPWDNSTQEHWQALHCVIEALGVAGIPTVYFPMTEERAKRKLGFHPPVDSQEQTFHWKIKGPQDVGWDNWRKNSADSLELERSLPYDPYTFANSKAVLAGTFSHTNADSVSVLGGIIEGILQPYFRFTPTSPPSEQGSDSSAVRESSRYAVQIFSGTKLGERKLVFLYAITLFRHSRHVNALMSEGVYQCPARFNTQAIDNDVLRAEEISTWIGELHRHRIFFHKPGGSVWMHRDVRLIIRSFLEHLDLRAANAETEYAERAKASSGHRFLLELRARLHFWIGDWYQKAFCSSGHVTPVIESLYHRIRAAIHSPFASFSITEHGLAAAAPDPLVVTANNTTPRQPDPNLQLLKYRVLLFESSLIEAQKTLFMAWRTLRLWQPSPVEVSWLSVTHIETLQIHLGQASESIVNAVGQLDRNFYEESRRRMNVARDGLFETLRALARELLLVGGASDLPGEKDPPQTATPGPSPLNSALSAFDLGRSAPANRKAGNGQNSHPYINHSWKNVDDESRLSSQIEAAFQAVGGENLLQSIRAVVNAKGLLNDTRADEAIRGYAVAKAEWKFLQASDPQQLHNMIWLLGEYAFVMLRRAKLKFHAYGHVHFSDWSAVTIAANLGIDYCRHLPAWLLRFDLSSKVRLHTIYGVSLANLGRFFESGRHFVEGHSFLSKMPDASKADTAIIMLRHAESLITECLWIKMFLAECRLRLKPEFDFKRVSSSPLPTTVNDRILDKAAEFVLINGQPDSEDWSEGFVQSALKTANLVAVPPRIADAIRKACSPGSNDTTEAKRDVAHRSAESLQRLYKSVLDEAVNLLDTAEGHLAGHSQASLWWSRLHLLRLRAYSLLPELGDAAHDSLLLRKTSPQQGIGESFRNASLLARDEVRRFRTLKYFFQAHRWLSELDVQLTDCLAAAHVEFKSLLDRLMLDQPKKNEEFESYTTRKELGKGGPNHLLKLAVSRTYFEIFRH